MAGILDDIGPYLGIKNGNEPPSELRQKIDTIFGIQGAKWPDSPPREMAHGESIEGEVISVQFGQDNQVNYVVETGRGERVLVPQSADMDFEKGDSIEATRTDRGYDACVDDRGMGR